MRSTTVKLRQYILLSYGTTRSTLNRTAQCEKDCESGNQQNMNGIVASVWSRFDSNITIFTNFKAPALCCCNLCLSYLPIVIFFGMLAYCYIQYVTRRVNGIHARESCIEFAVKVHTQYGTIYQSVTVLWKRFKSRSRKTTGCTVLP